MSRTGCRLLSGAGNEFQLLLADGAFPCLSAVFHKVCEKWKRIWGFSVILQSDISGVSYGQYKD